MSNIVGLPLLRSVDFPGVGCAHADRSGQVLLQLCSTVKWNEQFCKSRSYDPCSLWSHRALKWIKNHLGWRKFAALYDGEIQIDFDVGLALELTWVFNLLMYFISPILFFCTYLVSVLPLNESYSSQEPLLFCATASTLVVQVILWIGRLVLLLLSPQHLPFH